MKFLSIKEYFYKLNTIGFILLLPPVTTFIFLYLIIPGRLALVIDPTTSATLLACVAGFTLIVLTTVHWLFTIRLRKMRTLLEVARKMDGFYSLSLMRMLSYSTCSMIMALGFYLTHDLNFAATFVIMLVLFVVQWPTARSFCKYFKLTKNEREMILSGGDMIKR